MSGRMTYPKTKRSSGWSTAVRVRDGDDPGSAGPGRDRGLAREAVQIWVALLVFAVVNGYFRQRVLEPELGEEVAHVLSTTALCGAVFVAAVFLVGNRLRLPALRDLFIVGLGWAAATAILEGALGLLQGRRSERDLFADYDLTRGRLFALVLLVEITAPPLVGWLRRWAARRDAPFESRDRRQECFGRFSSVRTSPLRHDPRSRSR